MQPLMLWDFTYSCCAILELESVGSWRDAAALNTHTHKSQVQRSPLGPCTIVAQIFLFGGEKTRGWFLHSRHFWHRSATYGCGQQTKPLSLSRIPARCWYMKTEPRTSTHPLKTMSAKFERNLLSIRGVWLKAEFVDTSEFCLKAGSSPTSNATSNAVTRLQGPFRRKRFHPKTNHKPNKYHSWQSLLSLLRVETLFFYMQIPNMNPQIPPFPTRDVAHTGLARRTHPKWVKWACMLRPHKKKKQSYLCRVL